MEKQKDNPETKKRKMLWENRRYSTPTTYGNIHRRLCLDFTHSTDMESGMSEQQADRFARAADTFADGRIEPEHVEETLRASLRAFEDLHERMQLLGKRCSRLEKKLRKMRKLREWVKD